MDAYTDVALARECIRDSRNEECWESTNSSRQCRLVDQSSTYYRLNVFYPFIDHVITELEIRFSHDHEGLVAVQHLIPTSLRDISERNLSKIIMENS